MTGNQVPTLAELAERVTQLEVLFMHLQQTTQDLNQVLLAQSRQTDRLASQLTQLTADYRSLSPGPPQERNPLDERPPHY
jgi:uncharacterized coiled-coil protein SlyX